MPFGLCNAAQTFQRLISEVARELDFIYAYIDDILVASSFPEEHITHLRTLFQRLASYGITVNGAKSELGQAPLNVLGHSISADGIKPLDSKAEAIRSCQFPDTIPKLRRFSGLVNYYRRFIPNCAKLMQPLTDLLRGNKRTLHLTPKSSTAFANVKQALASSVMLHFQQPDAPISITVDASDTAIGAVLQQAVHEKWQPIAFFSQRLSDTEMRYITFGRELLAVYRAVRHFRHALEGRDFIIFTDHKPFVYASRNYSDKNSPREARQPDYIAQFSTDIRHDSGAANVAVNRHTSTPLKTFPTPDDRFEHVHLDLVGPFSPSRSYTNLLTCIDRFTRWPEAIPLSNTSTVSVARAFVEYWVAHYGCPSTITSDRGTQFESVLFSQLTKLLGVHRARTTAYHPQANGLVERFHRQLKASLRAHERMDWTETRYCVKKPLQQPYKGPFRVIKRSAKTYVIDSFGQHLAVSVDRLKPAFTDAPAGLTTQTSPEPYPFNSTSDLAPALPSASSPDEISPQPTTRSGRRAHFPARFLE
ncbi:uncharacterized protein DEA37_0003115 [Paragonimus westermani]|uniref:Integrase catalytic domain-containing protein n=1 Tax=Paragonimus westermani TaxID=34504 RepID=A0A5J4NYZ9_9TREM|nr:uncharacterized protein DEA37_0003115 [Paragonimus westermani]